MLLITDSIVISNYALIKRLDLLGCLKEACTTDEVERELGNELLHRMILKGFYSPVEVLDQLLSDQNKNSLMGSSQGLD